MELEILDAGIFENLIFDLVCDCGLINPKWRTPGSDEGRDIEGEFYISDLSGYFQRQLWYIECKRYTGSIGWPLIWEKISYAETHNADVLLFTNTSTITPQAQNQVTKWNESGKRPTIRVWNKIDIIERLNIRKHISIKYGLSKSSLQEASASLAPLLKLLIKANDSLYSSGLTSTKSQAKLELSHALGELIDKRLCDLEESETRRWRKTSGIQDLYEWINIDNSPAIKLCKFDNLGLRAFMCYIKFATQTEQVSIMTEDDNNPELTVELGKSLEQYQIAHLLTISNWSNFNFSITQGKIVLREATI